MADVEVKRKTNETDISVRLTMKDNTGIKIDVQSAFLGHLLHGFSFHGGFSLEISARGDIEVDPHHLVEDCGLVIGSAFAELAAKTGPVSRFGQSVIPMDDALAEVVIDACGRPYLVYNVEYPQNFAGNFDLSLVREFMQAFANAARINLHCNSRYGLNGHHVAEALFKAFGKAVGQAYAKASSKTPLSTKGRLA
ncbi:MAG: imidazoleglycerol-phosphate dehydratase HisB [Spirochaetales bacterium]|nr:imidazoleglycerol-phosphate dehydratase HisB [Spirochaetales bacterium]